MIRSRLLRFLAAILIGVAMLLLTGCEGKKWTVARVDGPYLYLENRDRWNRAVDALVCKMDPKDTAFVQPGDIFGGFLPREKCADSILSLTP